VLSGLPDGVIDLVGRRAPAMGPLIAEFLKDTHRARNVGVGEATELGQW
jgi:hypothetical protein